MRAVIYARVSTDEQDYTQQVKTLEGWARSRGWDLVGVYTENASAWSAGHQAELARIFDDARRRKFELVIVWALDRVCREGSLAILERVHRLALFGVKLISYQEAWTEAPGEFGELLLAITGWVARMESTRKSERVKASLKRPEVAARVGKRGPDKRKRKRRAAIRATKFPGVELAPAIVFEAKSKDRKSVV